MMDLAEKWNPLEDGPPPDIVPERWDASHVGKRLADAFDLLRRHPVQRGPRDAVSVWPAFMRDMEDLIEGDPEPPRRALPDAAEVSRMEAALGWPAAFLTDERELRSVQMLALGKALGRSDPASWAGRRLHIHEATVRRRSRRGCAVIARELNKQGVTPW